MRKDRLKRRHREEQKRLKEVSSVPVGDTCKLYRCCREVRLAAQGMLGEILSGYNTLSDSYEEYEVIQPCKKDIYLSLVRRTK